ncbi:DUF484 family protein [Paralimibaculum aggregatum]|uniref:DUF484 family protein n=1 Tax=Paralimibaculum aggregatum TaxID=3036245 RepID=A0ABQ6LJQ2_9RHOB|nr:DUF484 family protein [Limibaculum sp. NKW23]GMG82475.1 DUF484 family protein [Limibaculum sp. NKW23]
MDRATGPGTGAAQGWAPNSFELNTDERDLIRSLIVADPELVLADDQVMRALIGETAAPDRQVVDLRDRLVERLESRLKRLVQANRSVIAAAYENVAGTRSLHRAVLALIAETELTGFLRCLTVEVPRLIGVEEARLCLEAEIDEARPADGLGEGLEGRVLALPEGMVEAYLMLDGGPVPEGVVLREASSEAELIFGHLTSVRSEAMMRLELDGAAGLLLFGAADPDRFGPDQGVDLLIFFGGVVERLLLQRLAAA